LLRLQVQALAAFGDLPLNVDLIVLQQLPHSPAHDIMHVRHSAPLPIPFRGSRSLATQPPNALFAARRSKGIFGDDDDDGNSDDKLKNDTNYMIFRIVAIRRTSTSTSTSIMTIAIIDTSNNQIYNLINHNCAVIMIMILNITIITITIIIMIKVTIIIMIHTHHHNQNQNNSHNRNLKHNHPNNNNYNHKKITTTITPASIIIIALKK
jgi:hypothetical protein